MHTVFIPEYNITRYIPEDLSECDQQQYIDMAGLIFLYQTGSLGYEQFRIHAIYKLMNMKASESDLNSDKRLNEEEENKYANAYRLSELIDTFFDTNEEKQKIIKQNFIKNPIPKFKPLWSTYYGPEDLLGNLKFGEYTDALRLFNQITATNQMELLFPLTAILYRRRKPFIKLRKWLNKYNGDVRQPYNSASVDERSKRFENTPIGFVYGVFLLFGAFQKFLATAEIPWGGSVLNFSIIFSSDGSETIETVPGIGMDSIMFAISESNVFGSKRELNETPLIEVFVRMYDMRKRQLEQEKQDNNAKSKST